MIMCKTSKEIGGMGHSLKRKEDARFIRGLGKYTDDVQLPGMLYMDIARSPFAYAKIGRATSELQSHHDLVCRLLLEKKNKIFPKIPW